MSSSALQLTQFKIQKIQCIGGQGRAAPYRITTYRGMELGTIGQVMDSPEEAINAPVYIEADTSSFNKLATRIFRTLRLTSTG